MAPFLQMGRIDVSSAIEEEFNAWYNTAYIPGYLAVPGCLGARRFVAVEGQPKYLTVYEFEHARVSESDTWSRARLSNPWTRRVHPPPPPARPRLRAATPAPRLAHRGAPPSSPRARAPLAPP